VSVVKLTQNVALNVDPTWMETIQEGEKEEYVYKEEEEDEKEQAVESVDKAGSGFRVFPFACRDDIVCDVDKILRLDQHEDMMLAESISH